MVDGTGGVVWFSPYDYLLGEYQEMKPSVPTRIPTLDAMIGGGLTPGLWVIAAAPGTGKSAFGIRALLFTAWGGVKSAFLSLEMTAAQCWHRVASAYSVTESAKAYGVRPFMWSDVRSMSLATQTRMSATNASIADMGATDAFVAATIALLSEQRTTDGEHTVGSMIRITSDEHARSVEGCVDTIYQAKQDGCRLAIVDYLQIIRADGSKTDRERIAEASNRLRDAANDLDMPIVVVSSMGREAMKSGKTSMHDLKGSGDIEFDATGVITLKRIEDEGTETERLLECCLQKNRNGLLGTLRLKYQPAYNTFEEV